MRTISTLQVTPITPKHTLFNLALLALILLNLDFLGVKPLFFIVLSATNPSFLPIHTTILGISKDPTTLALPPSPLSTNLTRILPRTSTRLSSPSPSPLPSLYWRRRWRNLRGAGNV